MQVGVVGATGFIGRHVAAELLARGHGVRAFGRNLGELDRLRASGCATLVDKGHGWSTHLDGLDAIAIATGALDGPGMIDAHRDLPQRIAEGARRAGIGHLVLVSAIGAAPEAPTDFLRSKALGEHAILKLKAPGWTVVRPSLVYGPGGSSMGFLSALAAFPVRLRIASGPIRPIPVDDLAGAIVDLLESDSALPEAVDAVGPERIVLDDYVDSLGRWLMLRPRRSLKLPLSLLVRSAKFLRLPLVNADTALMLTRGADGDPEDLARLTQTRPSGLDEGLARHPATPAERQMAALAPWLESLWVALALFWIASGVTALANAQGSQGLLAPAGIDGWPALVLVLGGAFWDVSLGVLGLFGRHRRTAAAAQAATILAYTVLATWLVPHAWADPLGQLMKNVPVFMATILLAQLPRR